VTAQGSALTRYRRALERRHIFGAEISAKEMGYVPLRDALGLLALHPAEDSPKYEKAARRWLGPLALESDDVSLNDLQLAEAALQTLTLRPDSPMKALTDLSRDSPLSVVCCTPEQGMMVACGAIAGQPTTSTSLYARNAHASAALARVAGRPTGATTRRRRSRRSSRSTAQRAACESSALTDARAPLRRAAWPLKQEEPVHPFAQQSESGLDEDDILGQTSGAEAACEGSERVDVALSSSNRVVAGGGHCPASPPNADRRNAEVDSAGATDMRLRRICCKADT
jgi:hypothetical protein